VKEGKREREIHHILSLGALSRTYPPDVSDGKERETEKGERGEKGQGSASVIPRQKEWRLKSSREPDA